MKMTRAITEEILFSLRQGDYCETAVLVSYYAQQFPRSDDYRTWNYNLRELAYFLRCAGSGNYAHPHWSIIAKQGNKKLPFFAFSAVSGFGFCPGAGECINFCYTPRAWRYPAALCRQIQNTVLLQSKAGREHIVKAMLEINAIGGTLRLYVDGDHDSADTFAFWMDLIKRCQALEVYGYSKSFVEILAYGEEYPKNYILNISSGHNHTQETVAKIRALPIVRGDFIAVGKKSKLVYNTKDYKKEARKAYAAEHGTDKTPFVCPGECGRCTPKGHACGSKRFDTIPIVILAH